MVYCKECGTQISKDSKFCKKCGANQSSKQSKQKKSRNRLDILIYILLGLVVTGLIFIATILFFRSRQSPIIGSNYSKHGNKAPKDAVINQFKAIDSRDFELYVSSTDYKGTYDNLKELCKQQSIDYNALKSLVIEEMSITDSMIDQELGDGWHKQIIVDEPNYSKSATEIQVQIKMPGDESTGTPTTLFKVPKRGWYMKDESEEIYDIIEQAMEDIKNGEWEEGMNTTSDKVSEDKKDTMIPDKISKDKESTINKDVQVEKKQDNNISAEQAEQLFRDLLVKSDLLGLGDIDCIVEYDDRIETVGNRKYYVIHVYYINVEAGHTATIGWYGIETNQESLYDFSEDEILLIEPII